MNQAPNSDQDQQKVVEGLVKAAQTLRSTMSTVNKGDVTVTLTAEPRVVQVKLPDVLIDKTKLETKIAEAINEAINANAVKIQTLLKKNPAG